MTFIAFHDPDWPPEALLAQIAAHEAADEIVKGQYWKEGKGCAVGCTIHGSDHAKYERRGYCPESMAHLEDAIFEGLSPKDAQGWPRRFTEALASVQGRDVSLVTPRVLRRLLTEIMPPQEGAVSEVVKVSVVALDGWIKTGAPDLQATRAATETVWAATRAMTVWAAWEAQAARAATETVWAAWEAQAAAEAAARVTPKAWPRIADILIDEIERCGETT